MPDRPPNVLLLVLDALRADAVEPFGAPPGSSPALAELARRGRAVEGVRATASWTLPSHIAMFTGQPARALCVHDRDVERRESLARDGTCNVRSDVGPQQLKLRPSSARLSNPR